MLIEYFNISKMLMTIDEEEKYTITNSNSGGKKVFITEYGLYKVLMQSRKTIYELIEHSKVFIMIKILMKKKS